MPPTVSTESIGYERGLHDGLRTALRQAVLERYGQTLDLAEIG